MSSRPVTITVGPDDVSGEAVFALLMSAYAYMSERIDPPSSLLAMTAEDFDHKASAETLIVARAGGELVGCVFGRPEEHWLYVGKLAVAADWRRNGIANRLLDAASRVAESSGLDGLELETRIELTENHAAFAKIGFEAVAETAHAGYDRPTGITMRRSL